MCVALIGPWESGARNKTMGPGVQGPKPKIGQCGSVFETKSSIFEHDTTPPGRLLKRKIRNQKANGGVGTF